MLLSEIDFFKKVFPGKHAKEIKKKEREEKWTKEEWLPDSAQEDSNDNKNHTSVSTQAGKETS